MKILFLGYDARYEVLINLLSNKYEIDSIGYNNSNKSVSDIKNINDYSIIVLPMSGIKNNYASNVLIPNNLLDNYTGLIYTGNTKGLKGNVESFLSDKEIVHNNTIITVDGIMDRISSIDKVIICILGYGNIGSMLYDRLKDNYKVKVGVKEDEVGVVKDSFSTSNKKDLEYYLKSSDLIINTVPSHIIDEDILECINCYFLDIASFPYGVDETKITNYKFKYDLYSSIPSKYAPIKAGKILLKKF